MLDPCVHEPVHLPIEHRLGDIQGHFASITNAARCSVRLNFMQGPDNSMRDRLPAYAFMIPLADEDCCRLVHTNWALLLIVCDCRRWVHLVDAFQLLKMSKSFAEQLDLETWFGDYSAWLTDSKLGMGESHAKNNHGTW